LLVDHPGLFVVGNAFSGGIKGFRFHLR
jgi:hypothetical protein